MDFVYHYQLRYRVRPWLNSSSLLAHTFTWTYFSIETPGISQRGEVCVEFAYHMRGDSMGRLEVRTSGGEEAVWERSGEQGDSWNTATVTANINSGDTVYEIIPLKQ